MPDNWNKTFFNWMENIRDWCISRQLWWGHRIPAWHCANCQEDHRGARGAGDVRALRVRANSTQDPDVLDTWFSSGLWPFSTLGWPRDTEDLRTYYPTSLLITGYDILFFWVARMMMMGIELTGEVPFRQVHMHGLVRDPSARRCRRPRATSSTRWTSTSKYGTDAVRDCGC